MLDFRRPIVVFGVTPPISGSFEALCRIHKHMKHKPASFLVAFDSRRLPLVPCEF